MHPHMLKLGDVFPTPEYLVVGMEYANSRNLDRSLTLQQQAKGSSALPYPLAIFFFQQLVLTLDFCHQNGVNFLALQPKHILIARDNRGNPLLKLGAGGFRNPNEVPPSNQPCTTATSAPACSPCSTKAAAQQHTCVQIADAEAWEAQTEDSWRHNALYAPPEDLKRWLWARVSLLVARQQHDRRPFGSTLELGARPAELEKALSREAGLTITAKRCQSANVNIDVNIHSESGTASNKIPSGPSDLEPGIQKRHSHPASVLCAPSPAKAAPLFPSKSCAPEDADMHEMHATSNQLPRLREQSSPFLPPASAAPPAVTFEAPTTSDSSRRFSPPRPASLALSADHGDSAPRDASLASVWAAACILFEMLYGHHPFRMHAGESVEAWVAKVCRLDVEWPDSGAAQA